MTLREIAILAKVSTATVSCAIHRVPSVNPVLARRIRKIIGYDPNTNARALVRGHSRSLGLIASEITNPFFPEIVQTFARLGVQTAIGVMRAAFDLSLNIPRDWSVIGFDDIRLAQFKTPPLTTQEELIRIEACLESA